MSKERFFIETKGGRLRPKTPSLGGKKPPESRGFETPIRPLDTVQNPVLVHPPTDLCGPLDQLYSRARTKFPDGSGLKMPYTPAAFAPLLGLYLDIDGTIVIQLVIFWFVVGFVHFVLVKPYMKVVEARDEGIGGSREEAAEMEAEADDLKDTYEDRRQEARRDAQQVQKELREQGVETQNEMVEDVRTELRDDIAEKRESIQQRVDEARSQMKERAEELAGDMVDKIIPQG